MEEIRKEALSDVANAEQIFICGVNPMVSEVDDPFLHGLFQILKAKRSNVIATAYSGEDQKKYISILPEVKIVQGGVDELCDFVAGLGGAN